MKKHRFLKITSIVVLLLALTYLISPLYLRRALIYLNPGIDDYHIFHNRTVSSDSPDPWKKSLNFNKYNLTSEDEKIFSKFNSTAFIVIHNDSLLFEKYWQGYSDSSHTNSFSVAKSVVGLLIGCAIDDSLIKSIDQPVYEFLPEFGKIPADRKLSIRNLLTMSSGLDWGESYSSPFSQTTNAYYGDDIRKLVLGLHVTKTPGQVFKYLSCNTQILALIIEKVTHKHLSEYASQKLWQPMNAEFPAYWSLDKKDGEEKAYCCFNSAARDFARIGKLLLNLGNWNGKQLVSKKYMEEFLSPASYLLDDKGKSVDFYGFQSWIINYKGLKINYARGILGQYIMVIPEKKLVIVRLGKKRHSEAGKHHPDMFTYIDFALKLLN